MRAYKLAYITVILICIVTCTVLIMVLPKAEYSADEKRKLTELPKLTLGNISTGFYMDELEKYAKDRFPIRKTLVGINSYYSQAMAEGSVYVGKGNYLYTLPVEFDENRAQSNISTFEDFAKSCDIDINYLVVPTAGYTMQDNLPALHRRYSDGDFLNKLYERLGAKCIKADEVLKDKESVFYKTDHHWTSFGAYNAYCAYMESQNIKPVNANEYNIETYDGFYGTTYSKSGLWLHGGDTIELYTGLPGDVTVTISDDNKEPVSYDDMFFRENLEGNDRYTVFLNGNHALIKIKNPNADANKKLLIIRDSFASSLAPFLANHYGEIFLVDLRYYRQNTVSELVNAEGIDRALVVYGIENFSNDSNISRLK